MKRLAALILFIALPAEAATVVVVPRAALIVRATPRVGPAVRPTIRPNARATKTPMYWGWLWVGTGRSPVQERQEREVPQVGGSPVSPVR